MKKGLLSASVQNKVFSILVRVIALFMPTMPAYCSEERFETVWEQIMKNQSGRKLDEGAQALNFRDYAAARVEFEKAVQANYTDYNAHRMLGISYYWLGEVDKAVEEYKIALQYNPNDYQTHMVLGIAYAWLMDIESAIKAFEEVLRLKPDSSDACMNLGSAYQHKGMLSKALSYYTQAVKLQPKNPLYHFQIGLIYKSLERYDESKESFKTAIKYFPYYEDAYLEYGAVLERQGDYMEAISKYKTALSIKKEDLVAWLKLGVAYLKAGDTDNAVYSLERALTLNPAGEQSRLAMDISFGGGENKAAGSDSMLENFGDNLRSLAPDEEAEVDFEVVFKKQPARVYSVELSSITVPRSTGGMRYMLTLKKEDKLERAKKIDRFLEKIEEDLRKIPKNTDAQVNMVLNYIDGAGSNQGAGGVKPAPKSQKPGRLVYQPRNIGNDLGLWIMGLHWVATVTETVNELKEDLSGKPASWEAMLGLAVASLQIGRVWDSLDILNPLEKDSPEEFTVKKALMVAYVELGEWELAESKLNELLALKPKDKYLNNIKKILNKKSANTAN